MLLNRIGFSCQLLTHTAFLTGIIHGESVILYIGKRAIDLIDKVSMLLHINRLY